jgi:hypothetical protein
MMMMSLYMAVLFFALVPGVLVSLPSPVSSLQMKAAVHAVVFALVWCLTHKMVSKLIGGY